MRITILTTLILMFLLGNCYAGTHEENKYAEEVLNILDQCDNGVVSVGARLDSWVKKLDEIQANPELLQKLTNGLPSDVTLQQIAQRKAKLQTAVTWIKNNF